MTIGERIKKRRLELGMSVDDLAQRLGKNRTTIYRYESEDIEKLPISIVAPLAQALNVSPAYIMGWSTDGNYNIETAFINPMPESYAIPFERLQQAADNGEGMFFTFSEILIFLRGKLHNRLSTSQVAIAHYLGITVDLYRMYENGKAIPNEKILKDLSTFFGLPLYDMYIKQFDSTEIPFHKRRAFVDAIREMRIYDCSDPQSFTEFLRREYGAEFAYCIENKYSKLDDIDKGRVMGFIEMLCERGKYIGFPPAF